MGKDWSYSKLSEEAAALGGADKVLEIINNLEIVKNEEFSKGVLKGASDTKAQMAPWFAVVAGAGVAGTLLVQKIREIVLKRKEELRISAERAAEAEAQLIDILTEANEMNSKESEPELEGK